jgi:hypothetical protein
MRVSEADGREWEKALNRGARERRKSSRSDTGRIDD